MAHDVEITMRDRPLEEIVITSEMMDAAMDEYSWRWNDLADSVEGADREMIAAVYRVMFRSRPKPFDGGP